MSIKFIKKYFTHIKNVYIWKCLILPESDQAVKYFSSFVLCSDWFKKPVHRPARRLKDGYMATL